jgi:NAD(P)-dependent dehydrogenase (short-subunit alcohol dehydrogenase family)
MQTGRLREIPDLTLAIAGMMRRTFPEEHYVTVEIEKVAKLVSFLCSDDTDGLVNGACWTADGGWTAN